MDLNTILIILGVIALIALVVHGLWSNRREKSKYFKSANTFNRTSKSGEVNSFSQAADPNADIRLTHRAQAAQPVQQSVQPKVAPQAASQQQFNFDEQRAQVDARQIEKSVDDIKISLPNQPVYEMNTTQPAPAPAPQPEPVDYPETNVQPKPRVAEMTIEELEAQSNDFDGVNSSSPELREQLAEMSLNPTQEPVHENVHFNYHEPVEVEKPKQTTGFVQLYVISNQNREFYGPQLSQSLENLGFIFGERQMYHRHFDLSVASPVLFSVANIEQPGTFDYYNMAEFSTMGVVLFMQLPSPGNNLANLRMMIRAAKTIAEDLGGVVLTDQQEIFDDVAEQDYLSRIA